MVDKNQAVLDYLAQCPSIAQNPLFFNFITAKDNNKQIITVANDKVLNRRYIDGSILKRYTFTLVDFKSISYTAIVKQEGYTNENVEEFLDVQSIIDWITEQEELHNYPDFGEDCIVEEIRTTSENPNLNGIDHNVTPSLAKYSVAIQIDYLDKSKVIWNNK